MDLEQLFAEVDRLSPEDREKLRVYLTEHQETAAPRTVKDWMAEFESIAAEFRGGSTDDEMREIIAAITTKSAPSEKGL